jgi:hypothetical protein
LLCCYALQPLGDSTCISVDEAACILARLGESVLLLGYQIYTFLVTFFYTFCLVVICWAKSEMEILGVKAGHPRIVVVGVLDSC